MDWDEIDVAADKPRLIFFQRVMTADEIRDEYSCSPAMERKLLLEREKNAIMRAHVEAIKAADTVHGEGGCKT